MNFVKGVGVSFIWVGAWQLLTSFGPFDWQTYAMILAVVVHTLMYTSLSDNE